MFYIGYFPSSIQGPIACDKIAETIEYEYEEN